MKLPLFLRDSTYESGKSTFIVAEVSANHGQSLEKAKAIIAAASQSGADAVKLQTYTPGTMTIDSLSEPFMIGKGTIWEGKSLYQLYNEAYTPWEWHAELKAEAERLGLIFFSTPFDPTAVDFLESINVNLYKVASFEIVDIPLLQKIAKTGKPVIMSTGMASLSEIDEAVQTLRRGGCPSLALLKCTSAYPAPPEEMNLRTIPHLMQAFDVPVGLSDHTMGIAIPVAAVAIGARIIEKHLTLSRSERTPDSAFSLEPQEFSAMVKAVRETEKALGRVCYELTSKEKDSQVFRRSLFVVRDMAAGEVFTPENLRSIRPGKGLSPKYYNHLIGNKIKKDASAGTPVSWDLLL
ncbi:MAG: pseudaminic acid synthase [Desulfamplus sp.]|nr:pseudaminic acid synthase [Desulfamplus sp.]